MIDVIYYHYFLYYQRFSKEADVHVAASLALAASESFLTIAIVEVVSVKYFCYELGVWQMFGIAMGIGVFNLWYYTKKGKEIVEKKPLLFKSENFSIICALLFFFVSFSWLFWGGAHMQYL